MEYRELIDAFAAKYGVTAPPGEEGVETIDVGGTIVTFREDPGARAVILSAEVGEMPPDDLRRFLVEEAKVPPEEVRTVTAEQKKRFAVKIG